MNANIDLLRHRIGCACPPCVVLRRRSVFLPPLPKCLACELPMTPKPDGRISCDRCGTEYPTGVGER